MFTGTNVAYNMPTVQSSTDYDGDSRRAVDGGLSTDFYDHSCTHTKHVSGEHWWQVDLQYPRPIEAILILERTDCCGKSYIIYVQLTPPHSKLNGPRKNFELGDISI